MLPHLQHTSEDLSAVRSTFYGTVPIDIQQAAERYNEELENNKLRVEDRIETNS